MHQMRISTDKVSSVMLRPKKRYVYHYVDVLVDTTPKERKSENKMPIKEEYKIMTE
jgi:hypothetical protein